MHLYCRCILEIFCLHWYRDGPFTYQIRFLKIQTSQREVWAFTAITLLQKFHFFQNFIILFSLFIHFGIWIFRSAYIKNILQGSQKVKIKWFSPIPVLLIAQIKFEFEFEFESRNKMLISLFIIFPYLLYLSCTK